MPTNQPTPAGYFNATELLAQIKQSKKVKVSQFLDNAQTNHLLITLGKPVKSEAGRYGYTFLPDELLEPYEVWLANIGKQ